MAQRVLEITGEKGRLEVYEDPELGYVYAVIPYQKRISPVALREIREMTLDPWRYVEGVGLVLDITAWRQESGLTIEDVKAKIEGKYREVLDSVLQYLETAPAEKSAKKKKKKRAKKGRRAKKKKGR